LKANKTFSTLYNKIWNKRHVSITHKRQISMPTVGVEPAVPASKQMQTHALDGAATGLGYNR